MIFEEVLEISIIYSAKVNIKSRTLSAGDPTKLNIALQPVFLP